MNDIYLTKDITDGAIKDVDTKTGIITGYFSIFGNKDSDGDIVMPGAFKKSVKENGPDSGKPRILHLLQHNSLQPLAKPKVLKEDKTGLYFESSISHTSYGKDTIQLYADGVLSEHSIGYQIVKREVDERAEVQKLTELKLWEGSTVSWGANMEALVTSVKDGAPDQMNVLLEKFEALETAMKGNYTDDTARQLEIYFKQIQQLIISLIRKSEPVITTPETEEPKGKQIDMDWIINKLKI